MRDHFPDARDIAARRRKRYWNKPKRVPAVPLYPDYDDAPDPRGLIVPCLTLRGLWLLNRGIRAGTEVDVNYVPEGILLTPTPPPGAKVRKMGKRQLARLQQVQPPPRVGG